MQWNLRISVLFGVLKENQLSKTSLLKSRKENNIPLLEKLVLEKLPSFTLYLKNSLTSQENIAKRVLFHLLNKNHMFSLENLKTTYFLENHMNKIFMSKSSKSAAYQRTQSNSQTAMKQKQVKKESIFLEGRKQDFPQLELSTVETIFICLMIH